MTQEINAQAGPVIELGPGTGSLTYSILNRGVPEKNLTLVEISAGFVKLLKKRFPRARVLRMDATRIGAQRLFENATVGSVVSGLGLRGMPPNQVAAILGGAFKYLRSDGTFYQITYGPRCPVPEWVLEQLGLHAALIGWTIWNLPPASVYRISRLPSHS
ncbi:methyltransferase domain-containing protein [Mesorhizobium sp. NZP2077]|uniref:class I SAM-dependent methyltransferase n=1 Tax=Mesorhizobium sp. NZP2077 TaxID=2483404 RepID=UPI001FEE4F8E|nr:methyltransferase domain-containing protein [Mesorhizobium sp. NZP2077]